MISLIEALNFRSLRDMSRPLDRFHVLVGPNASGKTTFLDVVAFLSDVVRNGVESAIAVRSATFSDFLHCHDGVRFELALEATLPESLTRGTTHEQFDSIRYEIGIGLDPEESKLRIEHEDVRTRFRTSDLPTQRSLFPEVKPRRASLRHLKPKPRTTRRVLTRNALGRANYYSETHSQPGKGWNTPWDLPRDASALANVPADKTKFPVTTWFRDLLANGIESIQLDSRAMRNPSPPGQGTRFRRDGSNLPWVIEGFRTRRPQSFQDWIAHLRTALPDLRTVRVVTKEEDLHRYLKICYDNGLEVPSWFVSDGTLRLLALTLPAYLGNLDGVLLIEEPENGIHPRAVAALIESLKNVDRAQVLIATHSPVILGSVEPEEVLCFAKDEHGATDIVAGHEHPLLSDWQRDVSLGDMFAAGVLG